MAASANLYRKLALSFIDTIRLFHQTFFRHTSTPLPYNQFFMLLLLKNENRDMTIRELRDLLQLRKQQMTPNVDRLVELGYVSKSLLPSDRRCTSLALTPQGRHFIQEQDERLLSFIEDGLRQLDASELKEFAKLSDSIAHFQSALHHIAIARARNECCLGSDGADVVRSAALS